jgi:hypothetical protein
MEITLLIIGAAIAAVGLYLIVASFNDARDARSRAEDARGKVVNPQRAVSVDVGKVLEEINTLLDKVAQRYRIGLILVLIGAALMIVAFAVK